MNEKIERSGGLTIYLIVALVASAWCSIFFLYLDGNLGSEYRRLPAWLLSSLGTIALVRFFSALSIWFWSKAGVIVYVSISLLVFIVNLALGLPLAWLSVIGFILLFVLIQPHWEYMVWAPYGRLYG